MCQTAFTLPTATERTNERGGRLDQTLTFDGDLDDVVRLTQAVAGGAAVLAGVGFGHVGNLKRPLEVAEGRPAALQLPSDLLPGDLWSGPVISKDQNTKYQNIKDLIFAG